MFNLNSLRKDYHHAADQRAAILDRAIAANRNLTPTENAEYEKAGSEERRLRDLILDVETRERTAGIRPANFNPAIFTDGEQSATGPFTRFGDQLRALVDSARPGGQTDPRLHEIRAATGMGETTPDIGGFAVQSDFSAQLLTAAIQESKLAGRCVPFPLGPNTNSIDIPTVDESSRATGSRSGGVRLYWKDEGTALTASKPKLRSMHLEPKKLTGLVYLTSEIVEDSQILEAYVRRCFVNEYAFMFDDMILRGSGSGQPLGILASGALVTQDAETGQATKTLVFLNLAKMLARLLPGSFDRAVWCINSDVLPQLLNLTIVGGVGSTPVYVVNAAGKPPGTLFGLPILVLEQCSTLGSVGDVLLLDLGHYILAQKGQLQTALSAHVRFVEDEAVLRFRLRFDGQPEFATALTPYQGTVSQGAFVALAAR